MHTSYHQAVTSTGRLSSADPNLQNIPVRTEEGRRIREAFVAADGLPDPGRRLLPDRASDHGPTCPATRACWTAFERGLDVHRATAAEVFSVPLDAVEDDQRRAAKTINFGLIYGMSGFGLARQLGISRPEAQEYIEVYFARYPGVKRYMDGARESARTARLRRDGVRPAAVPAGRARQEPGAAHQRRAARDQRADGRAPRPDVIKRAMIDVQGWLDADGVDARMIMQVHDELVLEVRAGEAEVIAQGGGGPDVGGRVAGRAAGGRHRHRQQLGGGALSAPDPET